MKNTEETEIKPIVIKLRGHNNVQEMHSFLDDFDRMTQNHPFERNARLLPSHKASIEVRMFDGAIHINSIHSYEDGGGKEALKFLCDLADKHKVTLAGSAKAFGSKKLSSKQLRDWYIRNGFTVKRGSARDGYDIVRLPK